MSVWLCIPSKRPPAVVQTVVRRWQLQGYRVALWRDERNSVLADLIIQDHNYPGYPQAVNHLVKTVIEMDPEAAWFVAAGDDTYPDNTHTADEIAAMCSDRFSGTFGVMQPTGDRWADAQGVIIERVAGSPWMGREWCERANRGTGPLWSSFFHMFADETLQCVAQKLGVFWQCRDVAHYHDHWARTENKQATKTPMPDFLVRANSKEEWDKSKAEFERLRRSGFEECM